MFLWRRWKRGIYHIEINVGLWWYCIYYTVKIKEFLQLGKIEKVLVSVHRKYTSLSSHWFISKPRKGYEPKEKNCRWVMMCIFSVAVLLQWSVNGEDLSQLRIIGCLVSFENTTTSSLFIRKVKKSCVRNISISILLLQGWWRMTG